MTGIIPKLSLDQIWGLAALKTHEGSQELAILFLQEWLLHHSGHAQAYIAWYELGILFTQVENYPSAEVAFQSVIVSRAGFPVAAEKLADAKQSRESQSDEVASEADNVGPHSNMH